MTDFVSSVVSTRQQPKILSKIDFFSLQPMRLGRIRHMGLYSFWLSLVVLSVFSSKIFPDNWLSWLFAVPLTISAIINIWLISIRRMHDINLSGWWLLLGIIPLVGIIIESILLFVPGSPGPNKFGDAPQKPKIFDYLLILATPITYFILYLFGIYDLS